MAEVKIGKTIDARCSLGCPGPLMELISAFKTEEIGTVIELLSAEKDTSVAAPLWLAKAGQELIRVEERDGYWSIVA
ncbi:MAG: sulfurtransferase TusA family protein, partial [Nitrospiraceae bacterium]|nr:sulfurtransferase TusA family protein [Nitrospiraceae bacterium]